MRDILFKAKHNGKWIEGFVQIRNKTEDAVMWVENEQGQMTWLHIDINTICQFTGEIDKNGKKIFDGDICQCDYFTTPLAFSKEKPYYTKLKQVVVFETGSFELTNQRKFKSWDKLIRDRTPLYYLKSTLTIEVIGNIHD